MEVMVKKRYKSTLAMFALLAWYGFASWPTPAAIAVSDSNVLVDTTAATTAAATDDTGTSTETPDTATPSYWISMQVYVDEVNITKWSTLRWSDLGERALADYDDLVPKHLRMRVRSGVLDFIARADRSPPFTGTSAARAAEAAMKPTGRADITVAEVAAAPAEVAAAPAEVPAGGKDLGGGMTMEWADGVMRYQPTNFKPSSSSSSKPHVCFLSIGDRPAFFYEWQPEMEMLGCFCRHFGYSHFIYAMELEAVVERTRGSVRRLGPARGLEPELVTGTYLDDIQPWYGPHKWYNSWNKPYAVLDLALTHSECDYILYLDTDVRMTNVTKDFLHELGVGLPGKHLFQPYPTYHADIFTLRNSPEGLDYLLRWIRHSDCDAWVDQGAFYLEQVRWAEATMRQQNVPVYGSPSNLSDWRWSNRAKGGLGLPPGCANNQTTRYIYRICTNTHENRPCDFGWGFKEVRTAFVDHMNYTNSSQPGPIHFYESMEIPSKRWKTHHFMRYGRFWVSQNWRTRGLTWTREYDNMCPASARPLCPVFENSTRCPQPT